MWYTQLGYSEPYLKRRGLYQQARYLLHELVKDRHHNFPCDCGACIYAAYIRNKKPEGRSFSKRTLFVYFLRTYFILETIANKRLKRYDTLKRIADRRMRDKLLESGHRRIKITVSTDIYWQRVFSIARKRTLDLIKKLSKAEKTSDTKRFLNGILNKKCFYTYYNRAGDEVLFSLISNRLLTLSSKKFNI